jgi:hypothetical protein
MGLKIAGEAIKNSGKTVCRYDTILKFSPILPLALTEGAAKSAGDWRLRAERPGLSPGKEY